MKEKIRKIKIDIAFVWQFALDDFAARYAGSVLGIVWAFLQPIITMLLYWFVFQLGFKSQPVEDVPFILWLISGLIPWFFVSDSIASSTPCMVEYNYLVKKVLFNISILPVTKVVSTLLVHFVLIAFAVIAYAACGFLPNAYYFTAIVYMVYLFLLTSGISYLVATLYVFFKDVAQIVAVVIQAVFWFTPIVWDISTMPESFQGILTYNPFYYAIYGYRNAFIYQDALPFGYKKIIYYWIVAIVIFFVGIKLFERCKKHFADVL